MRHRCLAIAVPLLVGVVQPSLADVAVSAAISLPGVQIGINLPAYPRLVPVPGYPVYYAPALAANYFFYDGLYWVYGGDRWYSSDWYAGPWLPVGPESVPLFILRVPVRYYMRPPAYFRAWRAEAPPNWGGHWGPRWEEQHRDWARWDHHPPPPAPLPVYQREYAGSRYPNREQQQRIRSDHYRFEPRDPQSMHVVVEVRRATPRAAPSSERTAPRSGEHVEATRPSAQSGGRQPPRVESRPSVESRQHPPGIDDAHRPQPAEAPRERPPEHAESGQEQLAQRSQAARRPHAQPEHEDERHGRDDKPHAEEAGHD